MFDEVTGDDLETLKRAVRALRHGQRLFTRRSRTAPGQVVARRGVPPTQALANRVGEELSAYEGKDLDGLERAITLLEAPPEAPSLPGTPR